MNYFLTLITNKIHRIKDSHNTESFYNRFFFVIYLFLEINCFYSIRSSSYRKGSLNQPKLHIQTVSPQKFLPCVLFLIDLFNSLSQDIFWVRKVRFRWWKKLFPQTSPYCVKSTAIATVSTSVILSAIIISSILMIFNLRQQNKTMIESELFDLL